MEETMKIIALVGSPRKSRSNTAALVDLVLEGAASEGTEHETIFLPGGTVAPCRACDLCHVTGSCSQKDEFGSIREKILAADAIVVATPNYIDHVSAQLKAFIDRCCGVVHLLGFAGRYGAAVVTSGGGPEEPIARYLEHFLVITGIIPVGSVFATMGGQEKVFSDEVRTEAGELGRRLVRAVRQRESFPEAEKEQQAFRQRMGWLMENRKDVWLYEYDYWKKHFKLPSYTTTP
jgi:multimeric flavodoxin WrbA